MRGDEEKTFYKYVNAGLPLFEDNAIERFVAFRSWDKCLCLFQIDLQRGCKISPTFTPKQLNCTNNWSRIWVEKNSGPLSCAVYKCTCLRLHCNPGYARFRNWTSHHIYRGIQIQTMPIHLWWWPLSIGILSTCARCSNLLVFHF